MNEVSAKRLLELVLWITENYCGYSLLDICADITGNNKLTSKELLNSLTPTAYNRLKNALDKKYIEISHLKKLIAHYETFLNEKKKAKDKP